jgi:UrcA family protein
MPRTKRVACISALLVIGGASALTFAGAAPAFAQESRTVRYGELNLNANQGADTLIRRVEHAADVVCGDRPGQQNLRENAMVGECELTATQDAISAIGHPVVTSRYYGRTPNVTIEGSWDPDPDAAVDVRRR